MLRVVCFLCDGDVPRPFAARPEVAALVRECFGPDAWVRYEDGRPVIVRDGAPGAAGVADVTGSAGTADMAGVAGAAPHPGSGAGRWGVPEAETEESAFFQVRAGAPLFELERSEKRSSLPHLPSIETLLSGSTDRLETPSLSTRSTAERPPTPLQNRPVPPFLSRPSGVEARPSGPLNRPESPSLFCPPLRETAFLSVAHSGEMAVCALSDHPVGVDTERADREAIRLRRSFSPGERNYCRRHAEEYPSPELLIFTRKEAVMKGSGRTTFRGYRELELAKNGTLDPAPAGLPLVSFLLSDYLISVACKENLQTVEKKIFSLSTEKSGKG